jgi:hypothetical protein
MVALRVDGPLFYANTSVESRLLALVQEADPKAEAHPRPSVSTDLDVQALDMLVELADRIEGDGAELRLASVRAPALELLCRRGLAPRLVSRRSTTRSAVPRTDTADQGRLCRLVCGEGSSALAVQPVRRGLRIGYHGGDAVSGAYKPKFPLTGGRIVKVVFDVADDAYRDVQRELAAAIARD